MRELYNLIVDLSAPAASAQATVGVRIDGPAVADDATLAWMDATFGGWWSSEAAAGDNFVARRNGDVVGFATIDPRGLRFSWLQGVAREPGVGIFGPFGVAREQRGTGLGKALLDAALRELQRRGYSRALICAVGEEPLVRYYAECAGATIAERFDQGALARPRRRTVVLASGNGSNLQSLLDAAASGALPLEIAGVVSNNPHAFAVERARRAGVANVEVVSWKRPDETRDRYDARLLETVRALEPDLVLLLGWMHLLDDSFVQTFGETLNLHPAFLPLDPQRDDVVMPDGIRIPAFRGPRAVRDALAAASPWTGASFHRVTSHTDRGPVLTRKPLRVSPGETEEEVMPRVHALERDVVRAGITRWLYEWQTCVPDWWRQGDSNS